MAHQEAAAAVFGHPQVLHRVLLLLRPRLPHLRHVLPQHPVRRSQRRVRQQVSESERPRAAALLYRVWRGQARGGGVCVGS